MLRQTPTLSEEALQICDLARKNDIPGLRALVAAGTDINVVVDRGSLSPYTLTCVGVLAQAGDYDAAKVLMDHFSGNKDDALLGAARGGHMDVIEKLDSRFAKKRSYFFAITLLDDLASEAMRYGHFECAEQLVKRGAQRDNVVLACAEYLDTANQQDSLQGKKSERVLELLSRMEDDVLCKLIITKISHGDSGAANKLLTQDAILHHYMKSYDVNFQQAYALMTQPELFIWLLQGQQLVTGKDVNGSDVEEMANLLLLPPEIYLLISSYVFHSPEKKIGNISAIVNKRREDYLMGNTNTIFCRRETDKTANHYQKHETGCRIS